MTRAAEKILATLVMGRAFHSASNSLSSSSRVALPGFFLRSGRDWGRTSLRRRRSGPASSRSRTSLRNRRFGPGVLLEEIFIIHGIDPLVECVFGEIFFISADFVQ